MNRSRFFPEFSLLDLVRIVTRHPRLFVATAVLAGLIAFGGSFLVEPQYEATSSLLPPLGEKVHGFTSVLERGMIRGGLRIRNTETRNSLNMERLLGRELRYEMVDSLGLVDFFELSEVAAEDPERAKELAAHELLDVTHFELSLKIKVLIISVVTRDPIMSARIANTYLQLLDRHNIQTIRERAKRKVVYFDQRLKELRAASRRIREQLIELQDEHGLADFGIQREQALETISGLQGHLLDLELRKSRLLQDYEPGYIEIALLDAEAEVYRRVLDNFRRKREAAPDETGGEDFDQVLGFPLAETARLGSRIRQLSWDRDALRAIEGAMLAERERLRLEQFIDVSTTTVLDRAIVPAEPIWPDRKLIVLLSVFVSLIVVYLSLLFWQALMRSAGGRDRDSLRRFLAET